VQAKYVAVLGSIVSPTCLQAYRLATDRDDLDALARYLWNMALSEALYPSLQNMEIALLTPPRKPYPAWLT